MQPVVALSSVEAMYRAMAWGYVASATSMKLYCDKKAAIAMTHDQDQHDRTKLIEIDQDFIKEKINNDIIGIQFVRLEIK